MTGRSLPREPVVAVLALADQHPFELAIASEVFGLRRREVLARGRGWYELKITTPDPSRPVPTAGGFAMAVEHGLDELASADTVLVPGVPILSHAWDRDVEAPARLVEEPVREALRAAAGRGARLVSFCTGAFALAEAGLLDGRRATTHWMWSDELRRRFPRVQLERDVLYVDDGEVLTSAGSAAGIDLSLYLVRQDHGADAADIVARRMVVPPHRDGGQAQFARQPMPACDERTLAATMDWAVAHLDEPLTIADIAGRAAMSERTFYRRFREATGVAPHEWLTQQRLARARQLLETTDDTIDAVATRSGFGTAVNLRTWFQRDGGLPPSVYRRRFRRVDDSAGLARAASG